MAKRSAPRHGSLQFWPRKRAKKIIPRIRSWAKVKETKLLGFPAYKVGMTHVQYKDTVKKSETEGQQINIPVTVLECPPIKILSALFYKLTPYGLKLSKEVLAPKLDKELLRRLPKNNQTHKLDDIKAEDYYDIKIKIYTQPSKTTIGKKIPDIMQIALGGSNEDKLAFIKEHFSKEISINDVFKAGNLVDIHGVTKGKGFQGPVKRFGVSLKSHKSEKKIRATGNLGAWTPSKVSFRVPQPGKMGFHLRTEYNKELIAIKNPDDVNPKQGFHKYGLTKTDVALIKGSVSGSKKRIVMLTEVTRLPQKDEALDLNFIKQ